MHASTSLSALVLSAFVCNVAAFPALFHSSLTNYNSTLVDIPVEATAEKPCPFAELRKRQLGGPVSGVMLPFDPTTQRISTTGVHAFVPPTSSDLRGLCPGLNVLANHGYLPHNGYASITQYIEAVRSVFGMSVELGTFLSAVGTVFTGDPTNIPPSWSMGDRPNDAQVGLNLLGGALISRGNGINNAHATYEGDGSIARGDWWQFNGDAVTLRMNYFKDLYFRKGSNPNFNYDLGTWMAHCSARNLQSLNGNPQYFTANFASFVASKAAYFFASRLMANFSEGDNIEGKLTPAILKSFFAISGPDSNLKWTPGYERFPENWNRRPIALEYGQAGVFTDLIAMIKIYPNTGQIGGNTGTVNSFVGINVADFTGGVYNGADLLNPVKLQCFMLQLLQISAIDFLSQKSGLLGTVLSLVDTTLGDVLGSTISTLGCPVLPGVNNVLLEQFPGRKVPKSSGSGGLLGGLGIF
ncbi:MAG: hypothetical protein M1814_004619 [Vezdaea aestivalis]|nr:MAG: hypothetical protein M1814_004619 [Vezdaea aestivalis]